MPMPAPKPSLPKPSLHEVQALLQAAILNADDHVLAALTDGAHAPRHTLLGVYRHAYTARLIEVLTRDYPLLRGYMVDDQFDRLADAFISAHPSRSPNVRWFGAPFPEFLATHALASGHVQFAELAAIERAVADAFDSPDAPVLGLADLAVYAPEEWERLTFSLHPSVTLLEGSTNAFAIWRALKDEEPPPTAEPLSPSQHIVVWRQGTTPKVRLMHDEEAMMFREAGKGVRFGVLCEMLATFDDPGNAPARAAGYLQSWMMSDMLTSAALSMRLRRLSEPNLPMADQ